MTKPNKGRFGQRDPVEEYLWRSIGGQHSWQTRERKPGIYEWLQFIGAIGGRRGGGARFVKRSSNINHGVSA